MNIFKRAAIGFIMVLIGFPFISASKTITVTPIPHEVPIPQPATPQIAPNALTAWLDTLETYECAGSCIGNPHFRSLDANGKYSYGCLQFQSATWQAEIARYGADVPGIDIYDCADQKVIAYRMLTANPGLWTDWATSVKRGAGLPPTI